MAGSVRGPDGSVGRGAPETLVSQWSGEQGSIRKGLEVALLDAAYEFLQLLRRTGNDEGGRLTLAYTDRSVIDSHLEAGLSLLTRRGLLPLTRTHDRFPSQVLRDTMNEVA